MDYTALKKLAHELAKKGKMNSELKVTVIGAGVMGSDISRVSAVAEYEAVVRESSFAVIGAGVKGSGISRISAVAEYEAVVREISQDLLGLIKIKRFFFKAVEKANKMNSELKESRLEKLTRRSQQAFDTAFQSCFQTRFSMFFGLLGLKKYMNLAMNGNKEGG